MQNIQRPPSLMVELLSMRCSHVASSGPLVAILIDGDNVQLSEAKLVEILQAAEMKGQVVARHVYGSWATSIQSGWTDLLLKYAFTPKCHIATPKKNATDIALAVDAIDLFYQGITHFFLASSDSDFLPLIHRLRMNNCYVISVSDPAKNASLSLACNGTIPLTHIKQKVLAPSAEQPSARSKKKTNVEKKSEPTKKAPTKKAASVIQKKPKNQPAVASTPKVLKPLDDPGLTQEIKSAFLAVTAHKIPKTALLVDIVKELRARSTTLRPKDYGENSLLFLVKAKSDLFAFQPVEKDGRIMDEVSLHESNADEVTQ
ncbi:NYN domain-containing protein [Tengunoibacter tsumagoiensis]|uniref:NYN domain-containing protein n=1 Tax=Tengunoibacter tsumagoiensis TaxID=2014871 RepID=A0A402A0I6_9CHLR|nr:NYN domain-containing protein [Tengunoibacter tsumagoiensis]GCE12521.1 hypothetical protein KTT_23800 [Tengunoibacter tsumagoiensis]